MHRLGMIFLKIYVAPSSEPPSAINAPELRVWRMAAVQFVTVDKSNPSGLLATTVSGIPTGAELGTYDGATFTAFTANGDGTYSLTDSDIDLLLQIHWQFSLQQMIHLILIYL